MAKSNWAFKTFNHRSSWGRSSWGSWGSGGAFTTSSWKRNSSWAFSTRKEKGTYATRWGLDPERDKVSVFERKKPRFWIW